VDLKQHIDQLLTPSFLDEIRDIRRTLHRHPELSFMEKNTSAYLRSLLDAWEVPYDYPFVKHGILARVEGAQPGPILALRADMDALPIQENSDLEFASQQPGVMHACGHDVHMSSLLGTLRVLMALKDQIKGTVLFVFQPGEEKIPGGAKLMLEEGVFQEWKPDLILAQHVLPEMPAGQVGFRPGMYMASCDEIFMRVKGKGGHGALRHLLKDPILMSSRILLGLQEEVMAAAPAGVPTVLSFGTVRAEGATNVVPDQVYLEGTFRTMNEPWRKRAHQLIEELSTEIAGADGGHVELEILKGYPVLHNHEAITKEARRLASGFLGEERVVDMDVRMTAEDFAWFTQAIPGMMYRLGVKHPGPEKSYALHTPEFTVDESALRTGIGLMSYLSIELLQTRRSE